MSIYVVHHICVGSSVSPARSAVQQVNDVHSQQQHKVATQLGTHLECGMASVLRVVLVWYNQHLVLLASCIFLVYLLWTCMVPKWMWTLRKIPGGRGLPILGHLIPTIKHDWSWFVHMLYKQYHEQPAFQVWRATLPTVVVKDPTVARRMLLRYRNRTDYTRLSMRIGEDKQLWDNNLILAKGEIWRTAWKAFEAALMHPKNLATQGPHISQVLSRGLARLGQLADSGQPVDMLMEMYDCAIDAIGRASFGIDLQASARKPGTPQVPYVHNWWNKYAVGSPEFANLMLQSTIGILQAQNMSRSGIYPPLLLLFPGLEGVIRFLAQVLPDATLRRHTRDFEGAREATKILIRTWRSEQLHKQAKGEATDSSGLVTGTNIGGTGSSTVSEQSILARMLSGRDMDAHETFEDWQVVSHSMSALIAGYETTGTTVASSLWFLAHNPKVQEKAQQEVDEVLKGKDAMMEDLEQLPYIAAVMAETLRLRPAVGGFSREVTDDGIDLGGGIRAPKGAQLMAPALSYHMDPAIWPCASEYLPERHIQPGNEHLAPTNPHAYLPFGYGQRTCPGYKFAQMEARMALARLLQHFSFELVPGTPEPVWKTTLSFAPASVLLHVKRRV